MIWLIISILLISFLVWIMVTPLLIVVDTDSETPLTVAWKGLVRMRVLLTEGLPELELRILGFRKRIDFSKQQPRPKPRPAKPESSKPAKRRKGFSLRRALHLLRSFKVRRLEWDLDTGDFTTNGKLWPLFYYLSRRQYQVRVNFMGHNRLQFELEIRLYRILGAFLKR